MRQRVATLWLTRGQEISSFWLPRNRKRESCTSGTVGGAAGNSCSYPAPDEAGYFCVIEDAKACVLDNPKLHLTRYRSQVNFWLERTKAEEVESRWSE